MQALFFEKTHFLTLFLKNIKKAAADAAAAKRGDYLD